jgi:hypothetical protein
LHATLHRTKEQTEILEQLLSFYNASSFVDWQWSEQARLLLAEGLEVEGKIEQALSILNPLVSERSTISSEILAKAYLKKALLEASQLQEYSLDDPRFVQLITQLKTVSLQKKLAYEPVHLEANLTYIALLEKTDESPLQKRISLLKKMQTDFTNEEDLLSKDYHHARSKLPQQNKIYEQYMLWVDAEICFAKSLLFEDPSLQKELQAKAKNLLLQIISEKGHPWLTSRAYARLECPSFSSPEEICVRLPEERIADESVSE